MQIIEGIRGLQRKISSARRNKQVTTQVRSDAGGTNHPEDQMPEIETESIPRRKVTWPPQERKHFGKPELLELAETIKVHGMLSPICVVRTADGFTGVYGQRRLLAAELAGLDMVPAVVLDQAPSDVATTEMRIIENTARESLRPIEQASALDQLMKQAGCSAAELAKRVGMKAPAVSKALTLLSLPEPIRRQIDAGAISAAAGYHLSTIADPQLQMEFAEKVAGGRLGRDALAGLVKAGKKGPNAAKSEPLSHLTARLAGGRCVGIRGGEATIDGAIKTLEELLARLRPARTKGLSLPTVLRMLNDEARQA
jgi:ParB/RepB/Spo0J family partition protein